MYESLDIMAKDCRRACYSSNPSLKRRFTFCEE